MLTHWRRLTVSHPVNILILGVLGAIIFVAVDGIGMKHAEGALKEAFLAISVFYSWVFFFAGTIGAIVFLLRRQFVAALCYFSTAALVFPAQYAAEAMKGNTFLFVGAAHDKVAEIYRLRHPVSGLSRPGITDIVPGLIALGEECGPPVGCECWIAWDRAHNRGIEEDLGHWHRPKSSVFRMTRPDYFAIVNVRRIDDSAYSVSGCTADWSALWIR